MMHCLRLTIFSLLLALTNHGLAVETAPVSIEKPWIRPTRAGMNMSAGYFKLVNQSKKTLVLESVSAGVAAIEIHETVVKNNISRMQEIDTLTLAPGETVEFSPGGKHLMLSAIEKQLVSGDKVQLKFHFKDQKSFETSFLIKDQ